MENAKKKNYYYVVIIIMGTLMMFCGTQSSAGVSLLLNGYKQTIGLTGTQTSSILMVKNIAALALVFFSDKYYGKLGLRKGISLALVFGVIAMGIFYIAGDNLILIYLAAAVLGGTYAFTMILPMALLMRSWFNKYRPLAMSIASAGTGLSTFVVSPIVQRTMNNSGMNGVFVLLAGLFAVVAVILFVFIRNNPSDVGLEICGGEDYVDDKKKKGANNKETLKPLDTTDKKAVMAFTICAFIIGIYAAPCQQHFVLHFNTVGYDSMLVASAYSFVGLAGMIAKPLFGVISATRIKFQHLSGLFLALRVLACFGAFYAGLSGTGLVSWLPFLVCFVYAFGAPITSVGYTNWIAAFSTKADFTKKVKNAQFCYQGAEVIGAMIPGVIFDLTGSYGPYYGLMGLVASCVIVAVLVIYRNAEKTRRA